MSSYLPEHEFPPGPLPPLPQLPVIRETYCSQEITDRALQYLWDNAPELVREQAKHEHLDFDQEYLMQLGHIIDFFEKKASKEIEIPTSRLGMLDLLFEMSRRFRKARGIPEWKVQGRPLADGPDAPMPDLPVLPIRPRPPGPSYISQELADRIIAAAYKQNPDLFYNFAESLRRGGIYLFTFSDLVLVLQQVALLEDDLIMSRASSVGGEINRRLRKYCGMPDVPG